MPISDLLAEITGEKSSSSQPTIKTSSPAGIKRKANGDTNSKDGPSKLIKQSHTTLRDSLPRRPSPASISRSNTVTKGTPTSTNGQRSVTATSSASNGKPYTGTANPGRIAGKPLSTSSSAKKEVSDLSSRPKLNAATLSAPKSSLGKPSPTTPTTSDPSKAPKKGSFAEIMARAQKVQQIVPKFGQIQHKPISETTMSRKDRDALKRKPTPQASKKGVAPAPAPRTGVPASKQALAGEKSAVNKHIQAKSNGRERPMSSGSDVQEKKVRKSAMATTGYTGTARPPPKKASDSRNGNGVSSRVRAPGGPLAPPRSRSRYEEEEDDDLDDFIDYDDDEDDQPPRGRGNHYDYDSEGSSDMEAGMDDIYREETLAERRAREEDRQEEAKLERLKRKKEERKRRLGL